LKNSTAATALWIVGSFIAGLCSHLLYVRWNPSVAEVSQTGFGHQVTSAEEPGVEPRSHRVMFAPLTAPVDKSAEVPIIEARDVGKIRSLIGSSVRVRGRIFRVGHAAKSNTYFLNFGPSRAALTAVIFASSAELFEKNKLSLKAFEGKEIELQGEIRDHPQYGLEMIVENPSQVKILN
jgi:hypothetical protein